MIASSVWTARAGNAPTAVSPASDRIHPIVDRVGGVADLGARRARFARHRLEHLRRQDDRNALAACGARDLLLRPRHVERHRARESPRATIGVCRRRGSRPGARAPDARASRSAARPRRPRASDGAPAAGRPVRTKLIAARSTAERQPELRSAASFSVIADAGSGTRRIDALLARGSRPLVHRRLDLGAVGCLDAQLARPSAAGRRSPGRTRGQAGERGRETTRSAGEIARRSARRSPVATFSARPPRASRCGSRPRDPEGYDLWRASRPSPAAGQTSRRASRAYRAKFNRKMSVPAAISRSIMSSESLAGPTVAMILCACMT